ncbi:hypothetical protein LIER_19547 [Lithospermum erythrorhizon]|uniref:ATP-dependent DNA helicase n=1 Tax=Lithospermum erythrorhizon TaxID=34254 RepID=A0AAV3QKG6_LITER
MAEDFIKVQDQLHLLEPEILHKVLEGINDTLEALGRNINEFHLVLLSSNVCNVECRRNFFFIDGPGATGKSFLYKVFLAHIQAKVFIGLIVSLSGITAPGFLGGQTVHS